MRCINRGEFHPLSVVSLWLALMATVLGFYACTPNSSTSSGAQSGSGGSGLPPAAITVVAGNKELAASGGTTTVTVIVADSRGGRTEGTFYLTSSLGGYFITDGKKYGTIVGTTTGGIFITTFEAGGVLGNTEIAAAIPGTSLRGSTIINIV